MTTQFKKFLIGLLSLGCGFLTFLGLIFFAIPDNAELAGLALLFYYLGIAIGSIFVYYILLKRVFKKFIYGGTPTKTTQNSKKANFLLANKFSILTLATLFLVWISGPYGITFYSLAFVLGALGLFTDKKIGKIIILLLILLALLSWGWQYIKYKQESRVISFDSIHMNLPKDWSWLNESIGFKERGFLIWETPEKNYHVDLVFTKKESSNPVLEFGPEARFAGNLDNGKAYYYSKVNYDKYLRYGLGIKHDGGDILYDVEFRFRNQHSSADRNKAENIIKSLQVRRK